MNWYRPLLRGIERRLWADIPEGATHPEDGGPGYDAPKRKSPDWESQAEEWKHLADLAQAECKSAQRNVRDAFKGWDECLRTLAATRKELAEAQQALASHKDN